MTLYWQFVIDIDIVTEQWQIKLVQFAEFYENLQYINRDVYVALVVKSIVNRVEQLNLWFRVAVTTL